jgi:hypothetical protein
MFLLYSYIYWFRPMCYEIFFFTITCDLNVLKNMGKYFELLQPALCILRLNSVSCRAGPDVPGLYCWLSGGYECALLADLSKVSYGVGSLIWKLYSSLFFGYFKYSHVLNVPWLCIRDIGCMSIFFCVCNNYEILYYQHFVLKSS